MSRLWSLAVAASVTLVAMALRLHHITRFPLSGDEAFSAALANRGLAEIIAATTGGDPHPPLFYASLVAWTRVVGDSELSLRYFGVLAGVLLIPLAWWLGRRLVGDVAALVAVVWLTVHPYQVWYAHEVRMYLPTALAATLATACLWRWLEAPTHGRMVAYVASAALAMYTHYYAVLLVAFHSAYALGMFVANRRRPHGLAPAWRPARAWLLGQATLAALYIPWLVVARSMVGSYNSLGWAGPLPALAETLVRFTVGHTWEWSGNVLVGGAVAAIGMLGGVVSVRAGRADDHNGANGQVTLAAAVGSASPARQRCRGGQGARVGLFLVGWAAAPAAVGFAASLVRPMYTPRYLMVSVVAFALLIAAGVAAGWRWRRAAGVLLCAAVLAPSLLALYNLYYQPTYARSGYDRLGGYLLEHGRPGQAIVLAGWTQQDMFWYYYRRRAPDALPSVFFPRSDPIDPALTASQLDDLLRQYDGIWYVETDTQRYDPRRVMERHLSTQHYKTLDRWFLVNRLVYYRSSFAPTERMPIGSARFGDTVALAGGSFGPRSLGPGEIVTVDLDWQALAPIGRDLKVSLLPRDPDGHAVASIDREPADGFVRTASWQPGAIVRDRIGFVVPVTALPGDYRLGLKLYDPATGQALEPRADGRTEGDIVSLGTVRVAGTGAPSIGESEPAVRASARLGPLELVGYDPPADVEFAPGQAVGARLYVKLSDPSQPPSPSAEFLDPAGRVIGMQAVTLAPAWSPISAWTDRRVYAPYVDLTVPARAPTGRLTVRLRTGGDAPVTLFAVRVKAPDRSFAAAVPDHPVGIQFGQLARLAGYDGPESGALVVRPGDTVTFRLHWQVTGETDIAYKLFVHLVGPDGRIHGQLDAPPLSGDRPTPGWVAGEWLVDPVAVTVSLDAPAGAYAVRLGLYEERTGQRVPVVGDTGQDYVDVLRFSVGRP